jgi:SRSO17 transposase
MSLYYLQVNDECSLRHTKPLFEQNNPWELLIHDPDSMYCAFIRAESENEARSLAQSLSHTNEPIWRDAQWSTCTEIDAHMACLIDSNPKPGIVKIGFVRQFSTPF